MADEVDEVTRPGERSLPGLYMYMHMHMLVFINVKYGFTSLCLRLRFYFIRYTLYLRKVYSMCAKVPHQNEPVRLPSQM